MTRCRALIAVCSAAFLLTACFARVALAQRVAGPTLIVPFDGGSDPRASWMGEGVALLLADDLNGLGGDAITREVAVQRWPVDPKAPPWIATAALSRSASAITITAFLPPISHVTFAPRCAALAYKAPPTSFEPVKEIALSTGEWTIASPTTEPEPTSMLNTPGGRPASA